ncbi:interleukin-10 [Spea bombifrons]|uniref:interleukin-10 n=1 Tax=Spea bombifrons TaxID=233779 RepID=UPI002349F3C4|nr:interleukin-10 [Spea bombifrons]
MKFYLLLLIITYREVSCQSGDAEGHCQRVVNIFPAKLKELRTTFHKVKRYFQMKDDALHIILLQDSLLKDFKSSMGCRSVLEMIQFYLEEVIPHAQDKSKPANMNISYMKDNLLDLRHTLRRCHHFLPCDKQSQAIKEIKDTYSKMKENGVYKAMGEFDIFIDYIEEYLTSKRSRKL